MEKVDLKKGQIWKGIYNGRTKYCVVMEDVDAYMGRLYIICPIYRRKDNQEDSDLFIKIPKVGYADCKKASRECESSFPLIELIGQCDEEIFNKIRANIIWLNEELADYLMTTEERERRLIDFVAQMTFCSLAEAKDKIIEAKKQLHDIVDGKSAVSENKIMRRLKLYGSIYGLADIYHFEDNH